MEGGERGGGSCEGVELLTNAPSSNSLAASAELLSMQEGSVKNYQDRQPLFPGRRASPSPQTAPLATPTRWTS